MKKIHNYDWMRNEFMEAIRGSMKKNDVDLIQKLYESLSEIDSDKRAALDQGFRDYLLLLLGHKQETVVWESFLSRCVEASRREMSTVTLPVILLGDIFDSLTLDRCEQLFTFVENGVSIWKEDLFFAPCKNNLLRMCNDLLRRLSRSQNTVFCGRILLFLAKFFPFSERSGLNIVSEFNIDNITEFGAEDSMDVDEKLDESSAEFSSDKIKIDYTFYTKFWALQNFFRNPVQIYNKLQWMTFVDYTKDILSAFKSSKLEGVQKKKMIPAEQMVTESSTTEHYFAKFLTKQNLLELQLCDVNFRRYVLVQFLILFQYLNAPVKFKNEAQELQPAESEWVSTTREKVYSLLKETPPDGETFVKSVQHVLQREDNWNNWKNEGCPNPPKASEDSDKSQFGKKKAKKRLGQMIQDMHAQKKFVFSNNEMTRVWNYMPDNLEACRAPERNFLMSLDEYFKEAIEQLDPAAMVEDQYKVVNDENFGWRALRLLALQSSQFFTPSNNPINKLPEYLEIMIQKIAKDRPLLPSGEPKPEPETTELNTDAVNEGEGENEVENDAEAENEEEDELLKSDKRDDIGNSEETSDTAETSQKSGIPASVLDAVAEKINSQWKELADKLGHSDSIQYIEESIKEETPSARYVLQLCTEEEELDIQQLATLLENNGFPEAAQCAKSFQ